MIPHPTLGRQRLEHAFADLEQRASDDAAASRSDLQDRQRSFNTASQQARAVETILDTALSDSDDENPATRLQGADVYHHNEQFWADAVDEASDASALPCGATPW